MKELVFSFFACRATPLQKFEIDKWLSLEENRKTYFQWLEEWENRNPEYQPDINKRLARYQTFMEGNSKEEALDEEKKTHKNTKGRSWKFSAAVVLLFFIGVGGGAFGDYIFYRCCRAPCREIRTLNSDLNTKGRSWKFSAAVVLLFFIGVGGWAFGDYIFYRCCRASCGEIRTLKSEDGSLVPLRGNSSVTAPRRNFKSDRDVFLKGEADFSVTRKTAPGFEAKAAGTEFSVLAREKGSRVRLAKGKVEVNYLKNKKQQRLTMTPGEVMTLHYERNPMKTPTLAPLYAEYKAGMNWEHRRFEFNGTSLNEIADMLQTYGFETKIADPTLAEQKLSGSYTADNLEDLLQAIAEMMNLQLERHGQQLSIKSKTE